jgi:hypothetical protein
VNSLGLKRNLGVFKLVDLYDSLNLGFVSVVS